MFLCPHRIDILTLNIETLPRESTISTITITNSTIEVEVRGATGNQPPESAVITFKY